MTSLTILSFLIIFSILISAGAIISTQTANAESFLFKFPPGISLESVTDVEIDSSGNIYAAAGVTNILKFSQDGTLLLQFGSFCHVSANSTGCVDPDGAGPLELGDGQFVSVQGIALDSAGNIYVTDVGSGSNIVNDRVQKFDSNGNFLLKFGTPCANPPTCADGTFSNPWDAVIDSSGNIFVVDNINANVQKFNSAGEFVSKFGSFCHPLNNDGCVDPDGIGPLVLGDGQFFGPRGIDLDSAGNIYVVDTANKLQKFNSTGDFQSKIISAGNGDLVLDSAGNIYVVDFNDKVRKFNPAGDLQLTFGTTGFEDGQFDFPQGIALDSAGNIYVADTLVHDIQKFNPAGEFLTKFSSYGKEDGELENPTDITIDSLGNILVVDNLNDRIQKFNSTGDFESKFGLPGVAINRFGDPIGITTDSSDNIYVTDKINDNVQKFNSFGVWQSSIGSTGSGDGEFLEPHGVVFDSSNNIYVSDSSRDRILKFNSTGDFQGWMGKCTGGDNCDVPNEKTNGFSCTSDTCDFFARSGSEDGQFDSPGFMTIDLSDNLYVVDTFNHRIQKFNSTGDFQLTFGSHCQLSTGVDCIDPDGIGPLELGDAQFDFPQGIAIDSTGNIHVIDLNSRVQKFNSTGEFQSKFGESGFEDGKFQGGTAITFDSDDNMYVIDNFNRVQVFGAPLDSDNDGFNTTVDCNDNDSAVNPGATEVDNGIDDNCDEMIDEGFDSDADGFTPVFGADCDDTDDTVFPGAPELDDGKDNDCDGTVDNELDVDGDGFTPVFGADCDDTDNTVFPGAPELMDGKDNDCDGMIDEVDADGDGVADDVDNCPNDSNSNQLDMDGDDIGDACDLENRITSDVTLTQSTISLGNVIVQGGAVLTVNAGVTLDIDFTSNNLFVTSGSGVLVKAGASIS